MTILVFMLHALGSEGSSWWVGGLPSQRVRVDLGQPASEDSDSGSELSKSLIAAVSYLRNSFRTWPRAGSP